MINMCVFNAWIIWRRKSQQYMPLLDLKLAIAKHLCKVGKLKKRGRPMFTPSNSPSTRKENKSISSKKRILLISVRADGLEQFHKMDEKLTTFSK